MSMNNKVWVSFTGYCRNRGLLSFHHIMDLKSNCSLEILISVLLMRQFFICIKSRRFCIHRVFRRGQFYRKLLLLMLETSDLYHQ